MSIKCLFGKHDWEEVESFSEKSVVNNLLEERFRKYARERINIREFHLKGIIPADHLDQRLKQYVCLHKDCCAIKDEIKEFLDYWKQEGLEEIKKENQRIKRNTEAVEKFKNCLKEKE